MSFTTSSISSTHTYKNNAEINFFIDDHDALAVTIDTSRLHMRSVEAKEEDYNSYAGLFGDPEVMCKYATGQPKSREDIVTRINDSWVKRWKQNDPYNGLAVFKNNTDEFIGHVILGHGDEAGQSELAYLFLKNHWKQYYGTEAVTAVVQEYAPATVKEGYSLEGKMLEMISATARPDNPGSVRILEQLGMHKVSEEVKYDALRYQYSISLSELSTKA